MTSPVRAGIDVLEEAGFATLQGSKVGLVTNHTGLTADGRSTIDVLRNASGVNLRALFGPEHGLRGTFDADVSDDIDAATGLPIYSLFGTRTQPSAEQLAGIDTLVFDIQDIGCRFYTYVSTLGNVMEAAAIHGKRLVVLDRPNPITGTHVEGPLPDIDRYSFTAYWRLPIRHGMTFGELAGYLNREKGIDCDLQVIPCAGWKRGDWWDATGLTWTNPSPNMRSLNEATFYPGVGLLEFTNVSVGRGTGTPFELVGAPFIDARCLSASLNEKDLPGIRFVPTYFTPSSSVHKETRCGGVNLVLTDREAFDSVGVGITLATALARLYTSDYETEKLNTLLANRHVNELILEGRSYTEIAEQWRDERVDFIRLRSKYLLYDE